MSTTEPRPDDRDGDLDAPPEFELEWLCDDHDDCEEVTVFDPGADELTTRWITVDEEIAVPLEEAR